jgi:uroporphyrinogen decarboxylase
VAYTTERRRLVEDAFAGRPVARPLISLWRHWPEHDQDPAALGAAHLEFQRRFDFDFVKFTPSGTDCVEDWGVQTTFSGDPHGTREVRWRGVNAPEDWARVTPLDLAGSKLGRQLGAIRAIRQALGPTVPIFQTVFGPLTVARKLAGDRVATDLREHPGQVRAALDVIAADMVRFVNLSFEAGADGLFVATQTATLDLLTEAEHRDWGAAYDRRLLDTVRSRTALLVLHAHGSNLMFDQLLAYDVPALNWHDRAVGPSLAQMRKRFGGLLLGGIDEWGTLLNGPPRAIRAEVDDAVRQAGGRQLCLAAGCVIGYQTPDRYVRAARDAVDIEVPG